MILNMSLGIIITLIFIEIYYNYFYNENNEKFDDDIDDEESVQQNALSDINEDEMGDVLTFNDPNPWCKVIVGTNDITKYFIRISNFDENKYLEWKNIVDTLDYDVENKTLILETKSEAEALAVINLIISNYVKVFDCCGISD